MCGIAGKLFFNSHQVRQHDLENMTGTLIHRGPDDHGFFIDQNIGLAHTRLSILDLSHAGHQPMLDDKNEYAIVFNGEIYNFQTLRKELEKDGFKFKSKTDTEIILQLYKKHGHDCLKFLRGMFAFAIWDKNKQELFIARDRLGKKPLKYYLNDNCLIFASELKAILKNPEVAKEPDLEAIDEYLTYQYVPHPKTGFKNIHKLEPAHYMIVKSNGTVVKRRYWDLNFAAKENYLEAEWEELLTAKLRESVKLRLISDVPLGAHLSGGIDSSLIVALMAQELKTPVKTFSIGFAEQDYNELPFAKLVAEKYKTDHHEFVVEPNAGEMINKMAYQYEEPYADPSALPTWYLSQLTRNHVTVALNGDGGDENFAGYTRYNAMRLFQVLSYIPAKKNLAETNRLLYQISKLKVFRKGYRFLNSYSDKPLDFYRNIIDYFDQEDKKRIYTEDFKQQTTYSAWQSFLAQYYDHAPTTDWLGKLLYTDIKTYLPDNLLVKVDIASMAHSLEVRSPFLDHEFMELTAKMPDNLKMRGLNKKYLLKKIAYKMLPKECIDRPKQGFGVPLEHWFRGHLYEFLRANLLEDKFINHGWFKREGLEKLIEDHKTHKQNNANQLWALLMLRLWLKQWFE